MGDGEGVGQAGVEGFEKENIEEGIIYLFYILKVFGKVLMIWRKM